MDIQYPPSKFGSPIYQSLHQSETVATIVTSSSCRTLPVQNWYMQIPKDHQSIDLEYALPSNTSGANNIIINKRTSKRTRVSKRYEMIKRTWSEYNFAVVDDSKIECTPCSFDHFESFYSLFVDRVETVDFSVIPTPENILLVSFTEIEKCVSKNISEVRCLQEKKGS